VVVEAPAVGDRGLTPSEGEDDVERVVRFRNGYDHRPARRVSPSAAAPLHADVADLVASEGPRLYGVARRLCGDPADAEDLVQETFLQAFRAWHQLTEPGNPRPWLYAIARHACQRMRRRRAGEPARLETIGTLEELLPRPLPTVPDLAQLAAGPHADRVRSEAREIVEQAIGTLPQRFRMPLVLADIAELTSAEIARALGLAEATVKTRIHRARLRLRATLAAGLPQRPLPPEEHSRQVCLDLLQARLEAFDRNAPFPYSGQALCERCQAVIGSLDLARDTCASLGRGDLPPQLRERLLAAAR
jgi:RNA polymerase sigma-70 factor (ECF subfamily)